MTVTHTYVRTYLSSLFFNYTLIGSGYMYTFIAEVTKTTESMYVRILWCFFNDVVCNSSVPL